jgi:hypothetical protein
MEANGRLAGCEWGYTLIVASSDTKVKVLPRCNAGSKVPSRVKKQPCYMADRLEGQESSDMAKT